MTHIELPVPPKPWPAPAGRLPSSGGVTRARAFLRTTPGRVAVNLALFLVLALAGPPLVHALLGALR